jgi:hypothetical protein
MEPPVIMFDIAVALLAGILVGLLLSKLGR